MPGGPAEPRRIDQPKLLIGEGPDEKQFFGELLKALGLTDILVEHYGGKDAMRRFLTALPMRPGFDALVGLAVTRDADNRPDDALQSVQGALQSVGLVVPGAPGSIVDPDPTSSGPRVGVFILPGGGRQGMLEDLCLEALGADPLLPCVDEYLACLGRNGCIVPPNVAPKAKARAWLASRKDPDVRIGEAASKGYWPLDNQAFDPLKQFLLGL